MRAGILVGLVALVGAAAALAAPGDPQKRINAADQRYATSLLLTSRDLGPGWTGTPSPTTGGDLRCKGFQPDESDLVETGDAEGLDFVRPGGSFVSSAASVYRTTREAQTSWNRIVKPALLTCFQQIIERQATSQVSVKVLSKGSAAFPKVSAREAAYRLVVAFTVKSGTSSVTVKARFDIVLLGRGRADVALFMLGLREPLTAAFEQSLVRAAAGRLKP